MFPALASKMLPQGRPLPYHGRALSRPSPEASLERLSILQTSLIAGVNPLARPSAGPCPAAQPFFVVATAGSV
uniref:Uncharacterized protein n=1 Tax=Zea mays TaxID=4577 RepID=C0PL75_MAIZE|nr:unknown [Zea mays]